ITPVAETLAVRSTAPAMQTRRHRLESRGARPFVIPFGGSGVLSALAHIHAAFELAEQLAHAGLRPPDSIYVAAASFSTAAGLLAGIELAGLPSHLVMAAAVGNGFVDDASVCALSQQAAALWLAKPPGAEPLALPPERRSYRLAGGAGFGIPAP